MECSRLLHHRTHRPVLLLRQPDGLLQSSFVDSHTGNDMMNSHRSKNLRWALGLIGLNPNLISRNFLVVFLPKDGDDVERGTAGETDGDHLDWFCPGSTRCVVKNQVVAASGSGHKLALLPKCL